MLAHFSNLATDLVITTYGIALGGYHSLRISSFRMPMGLIKPSCLNEDYNLTPIRPVSRFKCMKIIQGLRECQ